MTIGDKVGQAGSYARDKASTARDALRDARDKASTARSTGASKVDESPLIALVGGLALGAVAAAFLPRTEKEAKVLGPVGNKLTTGARNAVQAARDAGTSKLDELGINKQSIGDTVKNLASSAAGAAKQAAAGGGQSGSTDGSSSSGSTGGGATGSMGGGSGLAGSTERSTSATI